jgi:hypothetical protein
MSILPPLFATAVASKSIFGGAFFSAMLHPPTSSSLLQGLKKILSVPSSGHCQGPEGGDRDPFMLQLQHLGIFCHLQALGFQATVFHPKPIHWFLGFPNLIVHLFYFGPASANEGRGLRMVV